MREAYPDRKRKGCLNMAWGALFLFATLSCPAQDKGRLPDSVSTSVDSIVPAASPSDATNGGSSTTPDTTIVSADSTNGNSPAQAADSVILRAVPDSVIARLKDDKDFAYPKYPAYWIHQPPPQEPDNWFLRFLARLFGSKGFSYFIYALLIGLLVFALYKIIVENRLYLFYRAPRKMKKLSDEGEETDLLEEDLDGLIQKALQARDFRVATRWLFLKTLRLLNDSALISYQVKSTNEDYIFQMSGNPQGNSFRQLARAYEYVWYGDFPLTGGQGERLVQRFQDFYNTINQGS